MVEYIFIVKIFYAYVHYRGKYNKPKQFFGHIGNKIQKIIELNLPNCLEVSVSSMNFLIGDHYLMHYAKRNNFRISLLDLLIF